MRTGIIAFSAALILCSWGMGQSAYAAKEKFQRTKPHVNVGTIGMDDRSKEEPRLKHGEGAPSPDLPTGSRQHKPVIIMKEIDE